MSSVVYPSSFTSKSISISAPRILQSGAKSAYINYDGGKLIMQTAVEMSVPFGLNSYQAKPTDPTEYSMNLSFRGMDSRPEIKEFMNVLEQLDEHMINEAVKNSKAWFKSDLSREVIKAFYTPTLKYGKDKDGNVTSYPPNFKVKLPKRNGEWDTKFYDLNGTPYKGIPVEDLLVKNTQVTAIVECGGVWFAGSKFGLSWRAKQVAIHKLQEKVGDFAFKGLNTSTAAPAAAAADPEEEDEEEIDDDVVFKPSKPSAVAAVMPQQTVEDDDADDVEPVPAPKRTVVKKKIVVPARK